MRAEGQGQGLLRPGGRATAALWLGGLALLALVSAPGAEAKRRSTPPLLPLRIALRPSPATPSPKIQIRQPTRATPRRSTMRR